MRRLWAILTAALVLTASTAAAYELDCVPGSVASSLKGHRDIGTLTLSGSADASDLFFIADSLPVLAELDIRALSIAPYHGKRLKGHTVYPAATIPAGTFGGSKLQKIALPAGLTLGDMAFASSALRSVEIPEGTVALGDGVFADCRSLAEVTLRGDVKTGSHTFHNCVALAKANLGGVRSIADGAFAGCTALAAVEGLQRLEAIGDEAFRGTALSALDLGEAPLRSIGKHSFAASALAEVALPPTLATVGNGAFFGCPNLKKVIMPASLAAISDYMFTNSPVENLEIPRNAQSIGRYALKGSGLVAVVLPAALENIGDGAMEDMQVLRKVDATALSSVPSTGNAVWADVDVKNVKLYVGARNKADFENSPQWQDFDIVAVAASAEAPAVSSSLRGMADGGIIILESDGSDIARLQIFKVSGEPVLDIAPDATRCTADLRRLPAGSIVVVAATLADGTRSILKFAL